MTTGSSWPPSRENQIFVDACLSPRLSSGLRMLGWQPVHISEIYPRRGERVPDLDPIEVRDCLLYTSDAADDIALV